MTLAAIQPVTSAAAPRDSALTTLASTNMLAVGSRLVDAVVGRISRDLRSSLFFYAPGTGGAALSPPMILNSSGTATFKVSLVRVEEKTSDLVNRIKQELGLTVSDLARVLRVERPTIYSWLRNDATPSSVNSKRISDLVEIADTWVLGIGDGTRRSIRGVNIDDRPLIVVLSERELRKSFILGTILASPSVDVVPVVPLRLSIRDRAARMGVAASQEDVVSLMTGRSLSFE